MAVFTYLTGCHEGDGEKQLSRWWGQSRPRLDHRENFLAGHWDELPREAEDLPSSRDRRIACSGRVRNSKSRHRAGAARDELETPSSLSRIQDRPSPKQGCDTGTHKQQPWRGTQWHAGV